MKNKLLSNLAYCFCAALGLLNFIFLAFPYAASFYSYDLGQWGGKSSGSEGISGYEVMKLWDGGFGGVMSAIVQILLLILGIAMLAYGVYNLLKKLDILAVDVLPEKYCSAVYAKLALYGYAALNVLLLVFLIILCATNTESSSELGYTAKAGIRMGAGVFITLVFAAGAVVGEKLLPAKLKLSEENAPKVSYSCSQCGKGVKKGVKFCPECGAPVVEKVTGGTVYACAECGKKVKAGIKFCPECGGKIEEKTPETL